MRVKVWGARGAVPPRAPSTNRYGGNTSCLQVTLSDGRLLVLDAGSGIRNLGSGSPVVHAGSTSCSPICTSTTSRGCCSSRSPVHARGPKSSWGPPAAEGLSERLARYLSPPLAPVHLHEPRPDLLRVPGGAEEIGPARIQAGPSSPVPPSATGSARETASLCYIPDQELALNPALSVHERQSLPGFDLAHGASLLVHDCQYTDDEYEPRRLGPLPPRRRARLRSAHRGAAAPPLPSRSAP